MQDATEAPVDLAVDFMDLTDDRRLVTRTSDARAGFHPVVGSYAIVGDQDAEPRIARIVEVDEGAVVLEVLPEVDLPVDLNTMDETGMPWTFLHQAPDPSRITPGRHIVVGSGAVRVVAVVADVTAEGIVHVQPLAGPVEDHLHLLPGGPFDG